MKQLLVNKHQDLNLKKQSLLQLSKKKTLSTIWNRHNLYIWL